MIYNTYYSNNISFQGSSYIKSRTIQESVNRFVDRLEAIPPDQTAGIEEIYAIIKELNPELDIEVKNLADHPNKQLRESAGALYCHTFNSSGERSGTLYLNLNPENLTNPLMRKSYIVKNTAHEYTHALQHNTRQTSRLLHKVGKSDIFEKLDQAFLDFEDSVWQETFRKHSANELNLRIPKVEKKILFDFLNTSKENLESMYGSILNQVFSKYDISTSNQRNLALKFFISRAKEEDQAHQLGLEAGKRIFGIKNKFICMDLCSVLYKDIAKYLSRKSVSLKSLALTVLKTVAIR